MTNLLATRELHLSTTESFDELVLVGILATDGHDDLTDVDTGDGTEGLTIGTTHTSLQSRYYSYPE